MTINRVRRTLSETEMERYGTPKLMAAEVQMLLCGRESWYMNTVPIARLIVSVQSVAGGLRRTRVRTQRGKEHEGREGDDPDIPGVDYVATIELEESTVSARMSKRAGTN